MGLVKGGYTFYGQNIGVLVFNQTSPRIPGDPGHSGTFDFQICYEIIDGSFSELIDGSPVIKQNLINGVRNLEKKGVKGIVGDCGLMSLYQEEMGKCSSALVFSSSLILVPLIWNIIGRTGCIGILTGHSGLLKREHLQGAGISEDIHLMVQGMEKEAHFREVVIDGGKSLDTELMKGDIITAVEKMMSRSDDIRAVLLECSNLASYSHDISKKFNIPVFDIVLGAKMIEYAVNPPIFNLNY